MKTPVSLRIRNPIRLIPILLLVALVVGACFWILDYVSVYRPQGELTYLPVAHDRAPPNEEELKEAMGIVRQGGWIREIAGDQRWTLLDQKWRIKWISLTNSNRLGIRFIAVWEHPVESDGPWYIGQCRLTRVRKGFTTFTNIRTVQVVVDMDRRVPVTRSVAAPFFNLIESASPSKYREAARPSNEPDEELKNPIPIGVPPGKGTAIITDAVTGEVIYEGSKERIPRRLQKCPPELDSDHGD